MLNDTLATHWFVYSALAASPPGFGSALAILLVVSATDVWVYVDAKRDRDAGEPVVLVLGSLRVETPGSSPEFCSGSSRCGCTSWAGATDERKETCNGESD
jgi:hypothetical protein